MLLGQDTSFEFVGIRISVSFILKIRTFSLSFWWAIPNMRYLHFLSHLNISYNVGKNAAPEIGFGTGCPSLRRDHCTLFLVSEEHGRIASSFDLGCISISTNLVLGNFRIASLLKEICLFEKETEIRPTEEKNCPLAIS